MLISHVYSQSTEETIKACVNENGIANFVGESFKRSECQQNEKLITWNSKGEKGVQGDNSPQLHVLDANNQDLGILIETWPTFTTYLPTIKVSPVFSIFNSTSSVEIVLNIDQHITYYTQENCTGNAFITDIGTGLNICKNAKETHYFKGVTEISTFNNYESWADGNKCHNESGIISKTTHQIQPITLPFTEPIEYPLHVEAP